MRLLVLATARDDPAPALADLLVRFHGDGACTRVVLAGLDVAATAELAGELGAPVARRLHAETDGNPFLLTETLRALADTVPEGAGAEAVERALGEIEVPEGVKQLIEQRIARLSATAGMLLKTGAVV